MSVLPTQNSRLRYSPEQMYFLLLQVHVVAVVVEALVPACASAIELHH